MSRRGLAPPPGGTGPRGAGAGRRPRGGARGAGLSTGALPGPPPRLRPGIGIRVAQGVTMHGFALNCDNDLAWFDRIVPCGISDADVTTLSRELGRDVPVTEVLAPVRRHLDRLLAWDEYERTPDIGHEAS